jgi:hypothetical protein
MHKLKWLSNKIMTSRDEDEAMPPAMPRSRSDLSVDRCTASSETGDLSSSQKTSRRKTIMNILQFKKQNDDLLDNSPYVNPHVSLQENTLQDPVIHDAFLKWSILENTHGYILLYDEIQQFRLCADTEQRSHTGEAILVTYLLNRAQYRIPLELPEGELDRIAASCTGTEVANNTFVNVQLALMDILVDMNARFLVSDIYPSRSGPSK